MKNLRLLVPALVLVSSIALAKEGECQLSVPAFLPTWYGPDAAMATEGCDGAVTTRNDSDIVVTIIRDQPEQIIYIPNQTKMVMNDNSMTYVGHVLVRAVSKDSNDNGMNEVNCFK